MQIPKFNQTLQQLDNKEANKGSKRPIEDLFSNHEFSSNQKKRHKRSDPQPGTSRQVDRHSQFADHEGEVNKRLEEFVKIFAKRFEQKLDECNKEAAVGGVPKTGKTVEKLATSLGAVSGGVVGLASGIPGAAGGVGEAISSISTFVSDRSHRQKAKRVFEVFRHIEKDKLRNILVKTGGNIFQSFESQFITVTDTGGSWARAMEKLAVDVMDRAINYINDYKEKNPDMNIEASLDLITKGVILGKSKEGIGATLTPRLLQNSGIPKVPKPGHTVVNKGKEWKISDLYAKVGIVKLNNNGDREYYIKQSEDNDGKYANKYGYHLPFQWELNEWEPSSYRENMKNLQRSISIL